MCVCMYSTGYVLDLEIIRYHPHPRHPFICIKTYKQHFPSSTLLQPLDSAVSSVVLMHGWLILQSKLILLSIQSLGCLRQSLSYVLITATLRWRYSVNTLVQPLKVVFVVSLEENIVVILLVVTEEKYYSIRSQSK